MRLPFSLEQFLDVFRQYNEAVWPVQFLLILVGIAALVATMSVKPRARQIPLFALGGLWLWMGVAYHLWFFRRINPAATLFGAMFVLQALLVMGAGRGTGGVVAPRPADRIAGTGMIVYAMMVYPALGWLLGHRYPSAPTFGLPCPTTIYTFGLLLWMPTRVRRRLLVVPVVWSVIGTAAALQLGMLEDFGLPVAAFITIVLSFRSARRIGVVHSPRSFRVPG